jgi:ABC-2 type transport system permease protein
MFFLGAMYGSVMGSMESFVSTNVYLQQMIPSVEGYSLTQVFMTIINVVLALIGCVPVIYLLLKVVGEEKTGHSSLILVQPVSRLRYLLGFVVIAFITSVVMLFLGALGLWLTSSLVMQNPPSLISMLKAMMIYLFAVWPMAGVCVLLVGLVPRAANFVWLYLAYSFFAVYLGRLIDMPDWLKQLTPFSHIPSIPIDDVNYSTLAILAGIALLLLAGGAIAYQKRDLSEDS